MATKKPAKKPATPPNEHWIQDAVKRPGAMTARAKAAGALTANGDINTQWLNEQTKRPGRPGQQARFAKTMRGMNKKK